MYREISPIYLVAAVGVLSLMFSMPVAGFGGDGNASFGDPITNPPPPSGDDPTDPPPDDDGDLNNSCWNDLDGNTNGDTDLDDKGCVAPIEPGIDDKVLDKTEGNTWDTDMSSILAENGPESNTQKYMSEGILFDGEIIRGPRADVGSYDIVQDSVSGSGIIEGWVLNARPERSNPDENNWGFGHDNDTEVQLNNFPTGTAFDGDKVVYPPNDISDDRDCGNGKEDETTDKTGDDAATSGSTSCPADWGAVNVKYNTGGSTGTENPFNDKGDPDMSCRDQDTTCTVDSSDACGAGCKTSCTMNNAYPDDPDNYFWQVKNDDTLYKVTCDVNTCDNNDDPDCSDSASTSDSCCDGYDCGRYQSSCCDKSCDSSSELGNDREWSSHKINYDCNTHNRVQGGGFNGVSNSEGKEFDWNDQAATYTDFTGHSDNSWGSDGKVWCGWDYTVTVDADGPNGQGEGFIVVEDRGGSSELKATEALNGNDDVGRRVWVATSTHSGSESQVGSYLEARDEMTGNNSIMSCPGDKKVCLKYVDYYTKNGSWSSNAAGNQYKQAVQAYTRHTFTPDDSYSVCKNINRIARQNGGVDGDLVRCDYTVENSGRPGGVERVSPLNEACGDDPDERLLSMEGKDIDRDEMEDYLAFQQECHDYDEESSIASEKSDGSAACVYQGEVYPSGSVENIADEPTFRSKFSDFEKDGNSKDVEVCLDIDKTNSQVDNPQYRSGDNGGAWYDIDDQTANAIESGSVDPEVNDYQTYLRDHPDDDAANNPGKTGVQSSYVDNDGFALEDDCVNDCEEVGSGTGKNYPVWAPFTEGEKDDDYSDGISGYDVNLDNTHNKVQTGGSSSHGSSNTQDDETSLSLAWYENSKVDSNDDTWALTPELDWAIANDGNAYEPGQCHGAPRSQGTDKNKRDAIYANSYARGDKDVYTAGSSGGKDDGDWIDPDEDTDSVTKGGVTCDLTGDDWGYAVQSTSTSGINCVGGDCNEKGDPTSTGDEGVIASMPHEIVVESSKFAWDMDSNPGSFVQNDKQQWKDACGDDPNEYLIREHAAKLEGEYNPTLSGDTHYACADRPSDCVLDGEVYSEGQLVDVSDATTETGVQSEDQEICLDVNEDIPGGEWWDVDNQNIRSDLIQPGSVSSPAIYVREGSIESGYPEKPYWHNGSTGTVRDDAIIEARDSHYSPLGSGNVESKDLGYYKGYALEDDCDSDLECDDKGTDETRGTDTDPTSDLIYSPFRESKSGQAIKADDHSTQGSWVVRMFVDGSPSHGSDTGQMTENTGTVNFDSTNWGWPTSGVNNSKIESTEDTWAVADETYDAVGPTGAVYDTGQCHGRSPPSHSEGWVEKNETVMANSFAKRENVNSDGRDEGNWVDPDTTVRSASRGGTSCDLNSTDWGFGYNTGGGSLSVHQGNARDYGYEVDDRHVVSGDVNFDMASDPLGGNQDNLQQYGNACGDDKNEFLIREQRSSYSGGEIIPDLSKEDIYVCADRITDCAYDGEIYSEGQTVDISSRSPSGSVSEQGDDIEDEEICLDLNKSTPGGEWYDKDQDIIVEHRIKSLQDTYDVSQGINGYSNSYDIEGQVVDNSGGQLDINGRIINVGSDGRFSDTVQLEGGTTQRIDYEKGGNVIAQKRLVLPTTNSDLNDLKISTSLMYDGTSVWNGVENFQDHDYDIDQYDPKYDGTDWRTQDDRYSRTQLSYFNRTHKDIDEPSHYNPEGYATEDDCGPLLQNSGTGPCSDVGSGVQNDEWFSAGNFSIDGVSP